MPTPTPAKDPITCHVLDTTTGRPAAGIITTLTCRSSSTPLPPYVATTNSDGRILVWEPESASQPSISALIAKQAAKEGNSVREKGQSVWKLSFNTGAYYGAGKTFFPVVELSFLTYRWNPNPVRSNAGITNTISRSATQTNAMQARRSSWKSNPRTFTHEQSRAASDLMQLQFPQHALLPLALQIALRVSLLLQTQPILNLLRLFPHSNLLPTNLPNFNRFIHSLPLEPVLLLPPILTLSPPLFPGQDLPVAVMSRMQEPRARGRLRQAQIIRLDGGVRTGIRRGVGERRVPICTSSI
ncbi:putative 5-hydroxyisourate hydrolase [Hyphodiscus hymeniophilus]|uniref:5-hydroxyisourate hydrolase n=1 Tax=Hyphodiscus hymeniophilus TaxID=353542 RepID=A0A9P6VQV4_9HELO|nr:putative 5-hydroxyisourate hydrolase [Hyphodiscus hymeniophilus]